MRHFALFLTLCAAGLLATTSAEAEYPKAKLHYFDVRGLGQAIRLMLADLDVSFEEVRYTADTWADAKQEGIKSGLFPFGQIPALEYWTSADEKISLVQSVAIMQFLGRKYDLYGKTEEDKVKIEVLIGGLGDLRKRYGSFVYNKDAQADPQLLQFYKVELRTWLQYYEAYIAKYKGPYAIGSAFTIVDVMLYDLIDTCALRVDPTALDEKPHLEAHYRLIGSRPGIAAYIGSDRHHQYANGPRAFFDTKALVPPHLQETPKDIELQGVFRFA